MKTCVICFLIIVTGLLSAYGIVFTARHEHAPSPWLTWTATWTFSPDVWKNHAGVAERWHGPLHLQWPALNNGQP
jgi:hypothetical protein